ncbi:MAG: acyl-CoA synthetase [Alicyclobacillus macrosporangiidus]|nr:acyl-CoA synthetase [Alicyclobacillus macrosporangiidus]
MDDLWISDGMDLTQCSYEQMYQRFRWRIPALYNIGVSACDRHAAIHPNHPAILYDRGDGNHETWTFSDLRDASNRLANALEGLGCKRGDRVAILLSQCPQVPVAHLAVYKMGGIAVPLFTLFGTDALQYRLSDSGARVLITDLANAERLRDLWPELPDLTHIVIVDDAGASSGEPQYHSVHVRAGKASLVGYERAYLHWNDLLLASSPTYTPAQTTSDDPAIIIYTSGTTGPAKGALHGHRILLGHLPGVSLPHEFAPQQGDLFWTPADWAWIGGLFDVLFPALHWGVPVLARRMRKFDPELAFSLMERWSVRNVFLPPTSLKMMRQISNPQERWRLQLRTVASGGEPLGQETLDWGRTTLGKEIHEFYGQTECNLVLSNNAKLFAPRPNSMGRPVPGHRIAVIDERGEEVGPGELGEVAVRRPDPAMFLSYWNRPEQTAVKFVGDWMRTGDLGRVDSDGYFYFVGRTDDVILSAGYRIGPAEVEEAVIKHPSVLMSAAVASPDPLRGEIVKLFVQLRPGWDATPALAREIQDWVKTRVGAHEYPREIEFVDSFPMTPSGKIQRHVLKRREYQRKGVPWR